MRDPTVCALQSCVTRLILTTPACAQVTRAAVLLGASSVVMMASLRAPALFVTAQPVCLNSSTQQHKAAQSPLPSITSVSLAPPPLHLQHLRSQWWRGLHACTGTRGTQGCIGQTLGKSSPYRCCRHVLESAKVCLYFVCMCVYVCV